MLSSHRVITLTNKGTAMQRASIKRIEIHDADPRGVSVLFVKEIVLDNGMVLNPTNDQYHRLLIPAAPSQEMLDQVLAANLDHLEQMGYPVDDRAAVTAKIQAHCDLNFTDADREAYAKALVAAASAMKG
jgi:hypothetical protein